MGQLDAVALSYPLERPDLKSVPAEHPNYADQIEKVSSIALKHIKMIGSVLSRIFIFILNTPIYFFNFVYNVCILSTKTSELERKLQEHDKTSKVKKRCLESIESLKTATFELNTRATEASQTANKLRDQSRSITREADSLNRELGLAKKHTASLKKRLNRVQTDTKPTSLSLSAPPCVTFNFPDIEGLQNQTDYIENKLGEKLALSPSDIHPHDLKDLKKASKAIHQEGADLSSRCDRIMERKRQAEGGAKDLPALPSFINRKNIIASVYFLAIMTFKTIKISFGLGSKAVSCLSSVASSAASNLKEAASEEINPANVSEAPPMAAIEPPVQSPSLPLSSEAQSAPQVIQESNPENTHSDREALRQYVEATITQILRRLTSLSPNLWPSSPKSQISEENKNRIKHSITKQHLPQGRGRQGAWTA